MTNGECSQEDLEPVVGEKEAIAKVQNLLLPIESINVGKHNRINFYKIFSYAFKLKLIGFGRRLLLKCHTNFLNLDTNSFIPPIAENP